MPAEFQYLQDYMYFKYSPIFWKRLNIWIAKGVANAQDLCGFDVADLHNLHILQSLIDIIFMGYSLWGDFCPFCGLILHSWNESAKWWQLHHTIALTMFAFPAYFSHFFRIILPFFPILLFTLLFHLHPWIWESGSFKRVILLWS